MPRVRFPIHHTFGPLVTKDQWKLAFKLQFQPWRWREGPETEQFRSHLSHSFGMSVSLFSTGREAILATLRALELKTGDEVIIQGYTCVVVPNAVHAAGGNAVYADIDPQTLSFDLDKLQAVITPRTKAIICQHTFGIPAPVQKLRAICDKRNLLLIEDCAHVIPDLPPVAPGGSEGGFRSSEQLSFLQLAGAAEGIGTHGDVLIFSFGRDKSISGVSGGAALTRHPELGEKLLQMEKEADQLSSWLILNLIDYPIRYQFAKWLWLLPGGSNLAKAYLRWAQLFRLLPSIVTRAEREGKMGITLHKLPNACAALAWQQLQSLTRLNNQRRKITALYANAAKKEGWHVPSGVSHAIALQKFPVFARDAEGLRKKLKREQIYLDDAWCGVVVSPRSTDQEAAGYAAGSCPRAEEVARHIVTLPTHPTMTEGQAKYLVHALRSFLS